MARDGKGKRLLNHGWPRMATGLQRQRERRGKGKGNCKSNGNGNGNRDCDCDGKGNGNCDRGPWAFGGLEEIRWDGVVPYITPLREVRSLRANE